MTQFNTTIRHTDHIARFSLLIYETAGADSGYLISEIPCCDKKKNWKEVAVRTKHSGAAVGNNERNK